MEDGGALVRRLASAEAVVGFWLRDCEGSWGQLWAACFGQGGMERGLGLPTGVPSGNGVRAEQSIILLLFLLGTGWGPGWAGICRDRNKPQQGQLKGKGRTQMLPDGN